MNNSDTAIIFFTKEGKKTALKISEFLTSDIYYSRDYKGGIKSRMKEIAGNYSRIVFISATGIAVRMMAPYIVTKYSDPAVVTVSDTGEFAISLLSGHLGGANELTERIAENIGAIPVITTASDNRNYRSLDFWMRENNLKSINKRGMTYLMTEMADGKPIHFLNRSVGGISIPEYKEIITSDPSQQTGNQEINYMDSLCEKLKAGNTIAVLSEDELKNIDFKSGKKKPENEDSEDSKSKISADTGSGTGDDSSEENMYLTDKNAFFIKPDLNVGMGCRKGKTREELLKELKGSFVENNLNLRFIKSISSAEIKKDEKGLKELASGLNVPLHFYTSGELNETIEANGGKENFKTSEFVGQTAGVPSVSEASALRTGGKLILRKRAANGITVSIAREEN